MSMFRALAAMALASLFAAPAAAAKTPGHELLVWAGDYAKQGFDFLAVIDADPGSPTYGRLLTSIVTDQQSVRPHHTEYTMPASGMLFANDHDAGRSFIFDVRDPLHPAVAASFGDLAGFSHPHSYLRLPNGHVLATFQHVQHDMHAHSGGAMGKSGGLVEIDDHGVAVRSAGTADPAFPDALLMPYGLVVIPEIDRAVSTNSSMHDDDIFSGASYQVWRLSDLKRLKTAYLDVGANRYAQIGPQEPRLAPDGSVLIQTLSCGLERLTGIATASPIAKLVYTFPGNWCGPPTIVGHYFVESVPAIHGFIVLDITAPARPVEVSRLTLPDNFRPHWTGWDSETRRLVVTPSSKDGNRVYLLKLDEATGALSVDEGFRDIDGKPGIDFSQRSWPHGWTGDAWPHGAVFSR